MATIEQVGTLQVFGFYTEYSQAAGTLSINTATNSFQIEACRDYRENDKAALIYISQLKQPKYERATDSVKVYIDTASGDKVAQIEAGVTFTPIRGGIHTLGSAANNIVQAQTTVAFTLQPDHIIYKNDAPQMVVEFPSEVQISSAQCQVSGVGMTGSAGLVAPVCTRF